MEDQDGGSIEAGQSEQTDSEVLTDRAQRADAAVVLSRQVLLVANGAHAVGPGVAIETTASGAQHGNGALIGLLGHGKNVRHRPTDPGDANRFTSKIGENNEDRWVTAQGNYGTVSRETNTFKCK